MMTLKTKLRKYRFLKDEMTQKQLADLVHVSRQTIHAIERGKFNPSVRLALLIAQIFQSPVEDIFYLE